VAEQQDRFEQEIDQTLAAMGSAGRPPDGLALRVLERSEADAVVLRRPRRESAHGWIVGLAAGLAAAAAIVMMVRHPHETVRPVAAIPAVAEPRGDVVPPRLAGRGAARPVRVVVRGVPRPQPMEAKVRLPTAMLSGPLTDQERLVLQIAQRDPALLKPPQAEGTVLAALDKKFDEFMQTPTMQVTETTGETP
jgi:hypothetical protein